MACDLCAAKSPVYSAEACCVARLREDLRRSALAIKAVKIANMPDLYSRRAAISNHDGDQEELRAAIEQVWNNRKART